MWENRCSEGGFYYSAIFLYNRVPDWLTHRYTNFQHFPKPSVGPTDLWYSLKASVSAWNPLRQPTEALCSLSGLLRHSCSLCVDEAGPFGSAQSLLSLHGFLWLCVCLFCTDLPSLCSVLAASWLLSRPLVQFFSKPYSRNWTDWSPSVYSPSAPQASPYTFSVDISTAKIKSLIND